MKLHNGFSPNGARVAIFLAEKGLDLAIEPVDVVGGGTHTEAFRQINTLEQVPVLELDDGRYLAESVAICRYLEERHPEPALFGASPEERAFVDMWIRRIELNLFNVAGDIGQHEFEFFKDRIEQNAAFAAARRRDLDQKFRWLDGELSDGRPFVAGADFSMADIIGMTMLMLIGFAGIAIPEDLAHARRWAGAVRSRPSFPQMPKAA